MQDAGGDVLNWHTIYEGQLALDFQLLLDGRLRVALRTKISDGRELILDLMTTVEEVRQALDEVAGETPPV